MSNGRALNLQRNTNVSIERGMRIMNDVQVLFVRKRSISAGKKVGFSSDRISYIILRGCWCHIICSEH
jgi:hypothetical protein